MHLTFESEVWIEGDQYVARANPLNVLSCGRSKEDAEDALLEAVELFLLTAQDMGTLEEVLAESGYGLVGEKWTLLRRPERRMQALQI